MNPAGAFTFEDVGVTAYKVGGSEAASLLSDDSQHCSFSVCEEAWANVLLKSRDFFWRDNAY